MESLCGANISLCTINNTVLYSLVYSQNNMHTVTFLFHTRQIDTTFETIKVVQIVPSISKDDDCFQSNSTNFSTKTAY